MFVAVAILATPSILGGLNRLLDSALEAKRARRDVRAVTRGKQFRSVPLEMILDDDQIAELQRNPTIVDGVLRARRVRGGQ